MIKLNDVETKLNSLIDYSVEHCNVDTDKAKMKALGGSFVAGIKPYYSVDRSAWNSEMKRLRYGFYSDLRSRGSVIVSPHDTSMKTDFPTGYNSLIELLYVCPILHCSNEEFFASWVYSTPDATESESDTAAAEPEITENSLLNQWVAEYAVAPDEEFKRLQALNSWLETSGEKVEAVNFWETDIEVKSEPTTADIAKILFIDKGLKEIINAFNLNEYVPSYV